MSFWRIQRVAFSTILIKEIRRFMRIWQQTLLPPAITMTLYFIIFGNLIGSRIGEMDGVDYETAKEALDLASAKLPVKTKIIRRIGDEA